MRSIPSYSRTLGPLVVLLTLLAMKAEPMAAHPTTANPCDDAIAMMQKQITEAYDNLEALDGLLQSWTSSFQNGMEYFSPEALRDMTEAELAKAQESLKALKECLPRIRVVFDRLKKRIGELEGMLNIDLSGDRLHHRRMEKISEVEELHAEVEGLLDSLIG